MFKNELKLYVYPFQDPATGSIITAGNLRVEPHLRHLYAHLLENHYIQGIREFHPEYLPIFSKGVLERIRSGDTGWEESVPPEVARLIKERRLLGYSAG